MGMLQEFKTFASRGNVVDMAVGVIIGGAFGKIVSSAVADIVMPPIGAVTGGVDFRDLEYIIKQAEGEVAAVSIKYGQFIQHVIDFLIVAFAVFLLVKGINALKKKEEAAPATPPKPSAEAELLREIRDLLQKQS